MSDCKPFHIISNFHLMPGRKFSANNLIYAYKFRWSTGRLHIPAGLGFGFKTISLVATNDFCICCIRKKIHFEMTVQEYDHLDKSIIIICDFLLFFAYGIITKISKCIDYQPKCSNNVIFRFRGNQIESKVKKKKTK